MLEVIIDILKLLVAVGVGTIIGYEREESGKPAGKRTLSLVCVGSTYLALLTVKYIPNDTGRVLAGLITGIGFLGAGVIMAHGYNVKGLTTAAAIWAVSIVGMGIGIGEYLLSILVTIAIYLILIERRIKADIERVGERMRKRTKSSSFARLR